MKKSTQAVLLSVLAFPGCGHLVLRHFRAAVALLVISLAALAIIINAAMQQATVVANKILANEIPLDPDAITQAIAEATRSGDSISVTVATWVLFIVWVIGVADAYRIGKKVDAAAATIQRDDSIKN
ncbi:MAG: hypothetical protein JWM78_2829 [Verrucomicrobiaceae bacterium]|nr:hypothetical protein [Verrucomicrobiaceae bacterium]